MTIGTSRDIAMRAAGETLEARIAAHVAELCRHPDRHVGGVGNRAATAYFARVAADLGAEVESIPFDCVDWIPGPATLDVGGERFDLVCGPYSLPCDLTAPLVSAATFEELSALDASGQVLLLHGPVTSEQLTPKNYPFYSFDSHARILEAIELARPLALIAATGRNPGSTAALYPFPLIEDADVDLAHACLTDVEGGRLLALVGETVTLKIVSERRPSQAEQVVARMRSGPGARVVVCAHIDSRLGTPGALDNAGGVATLLALTELLHAAPVASTVELVPFNGEDDYAAPGEMAYIAANGGELTGIALAINIDDAGYIEGRSAVSLYAADEALSAIVEAALEVSEGVIEGPAWPQSDHMVFAMKGIPSLALTAEKMEHVSSTVTHTAADVPALVDPVRLAECARFIREVLARL